MNEIDLNTPTPDSSPDFITKYLSSVGESEVPKFFHRWSALVGIGALVGHDAWFKFGDFTLYPNMYAMLLAAPGVKKSTAIKLFKKILKLAGYDDFAAEKTSKEKFLQDLGEIAAGAGGDPEAFLDAQLWGTDTAGGDSTNVFIVADEFNDFFGNNILEFISLLGVLWDYEGVYENKIKNGMSSGIPNPCVSILSGNTPSTFFNTFGQEVLGQGFFSRLLFIHGEPTGRKIAFPKGMSEATLQELANDLIRIKGIARGQMDLAPGTLDLMEKIYNDFDGLEDTRFSFYTNRRQAHFIKLCVIHALADFSTVITPTHVVRANTVLSHTEFFMPRALGEFGKAKNSDIVHKIITILERSDRPVGIHELWQQTYSDLNSIQDLSDMIKNLAIADRLQQTEQGLLAKRQIKKEKESNQYLWEYLTNEERSI